MNLRQPPLLRRVARKGSDKAKLAEQVIAAPTLLPQIFDGLQASEAPVKYGCEKVLMLISEKAPALLYPHMDCFVGLLESGNNFLKWGAIRIIANLAVVDVENKFEKVFDRYFAPIPGPAMITAGNIVASAPKIAAAKPHLAERIVRELLKVEHARYQTAECRNVALGHVILALGQLCESLQDKTAVMALVRRQLENSRNATRIKAGKFLRKYGV